MSNYDIYVCIECGEKFTGKIDCLTHSDKYGHFEFEDMTGNIYNPFKDEEADITGELTF